MKAIILSAGRGSRLLPLTTDLPKCLLPVGLTTVLGLQLDTLHAAGVNDVTVVTGFNAQKVEEMVAARGARGPKVKTVFNPFYQVADNLATCWMVRDEMDEDFIVINGDTLFVPAIIISILEAQDTDIAVTIDQKDHYDGDDMKVTLDGRALTAIGKTLTPQQTHAESIGMLRFMGKGRETFRKMLEDKMRTPVGTSYWYLRAINDLAASGVAISTINIKGHDWAELDTPEDYEVVRALFGGAGETRQRFAVV